jgi:hypothetical protein
VIAHVGGVPMEEVLLPWVSGAGAALLLARAAAERWISGLRWISVHKAAVPRTNDLKGKAR